MTRSPDSSCMLCARPMWKNHRSSAPSTRSVCGSCRIENNLPVRGRLADDVLDRLLDDRSAPTPAVKPARVSLQAVLPPVRSAQKPNRMLQVADPVHGTVTVWWSLDRSAMWRCAIHGRTSSPACPHTQAAVTVLGPVLLGLEAVTLVIDHD